MRSMKFFTPIFFVFLLTYSSPLARAQTFQTLISFSGRNGASPEGTLVLDSAGNLYGTTALGGSGIGKCSYNGEIKRCGTAFMLHGTNRFEFFTFNGSDGQKPASGLLHDAAGNFYGATELGGDQGYPCGLSGCGLVYKFGPKGKETTIYRFPGAPNEFNPSGPLVEDGTGNLYGASGGGTHGFGAVFKIDRAHNETAVYSFTGGSDGCGAASVILDPVGNLYGVSPLGGVGFCDDGYGVVFKVDPSGNETVIHTFSGSDGANPNSVLLLDAEGNLYGTTESGGSGDGGTVFELSPQSDGTWSETVLYSFCSLSECADGERPMYGPLVRDGFGNIYGTTASGGAYTSCAPTAQSCGTVFKLDPSGNEVVLHSFTGNFDGANPLAGLVMDDAGNLYGTASRGANNCFPHIRCGTVFEIAP